MQVRAGTIEDHIYPFTGAFAAHVGGVMPTYGQPEPGLLVQGAAGPIEPVGIGYNRQMLGEVLRGCFGFDGLVLSDWHIPDDCGGGCRDGAPAGRKPDPADIAMPWGVEQMSKPERFAKAVEAGVDQFGGAKDPANLVAAVRHGLLPEAALDRAATRVMVQKFELGLFENPYVDTDGAAAVVGNAGFQARALEGPAPLGGAGEKPGAHAAARAGSAQGVPVPDRSGHRTPARLRGGRHHRAGRLRHHGRRHAKRSAASAALFRIALPRRRHRLPGRRRRLRGLPAYQRQAAHGGVGVYGPADLSALIPNATAIVAHFGLGPEALFDMLTGVRRFEGRLPYDLPLAGGMPAGDEQFALRRSQGLRD